VLGIVIGDNFVDRGLLAGMQPTWGFGFVHGLTVGGTEFGMSDIGVIRQVDIHDNKVGLVGQ
jgi:hypothetical protein